MIKFASKDFNGWVTMNIGSGIDISIKDLVQKIHKLTNSTSKLDIGALDTRPTEIWKMSANSAKAQKLIDWNPSVSFEDGLIETINWYKKYINIFYENSSPLFEL